MKVSKRVIATLIVIGIVVSIAYYWYTLQQLNVVFTWIEWSPEILREGVNAEFRVRVENWVAFPRSYTLPIYLEKWGGSRVKVSTITISLGPGEKKLITFNITFKEPGFYKLIIGEGDLHLHQLLYVSPLNRTNVFRFAVFGDNRPKDNVMPQPGTFKELIRELNLIKPDFAVLVGDIIYGYRSDVARLKIQWNDFLSVYGSSQVPIFVAPGNHEIKTEDYPDSGDPAAEALYVMNLGRLYYAFEYGNSLFIVLDTDKVGQAGYITGKQWNWLVKMLEKGKEYEHVFVFLHKPACTGEGLDALNNGLELMELLVKYNVTAVFQGHNHLYYFEKVNNTCFYVTGGAGAPIYASEKSGGYHHFLIVTVNGSKVDVQFLPIPALEWTKENNSIKVKYLFKGVLLFKRGDYYWNATAKPLLLQGIVFNVNSPNVSVEGGDLWKIVSENGYKVYVSVVLNPGEERTISVKRLGNILIIFGGEYS